MISPEFGRAGFVIGIFVSLVSGMLLLVVERGSAEFFVSLITFLIGIAFLLAIVFLVWMGMRKG
jgi:hypothetical protein